MFVKKNIDKVFTVDEILSAGEFLDKLSYLHI